MNITVENIVNPTTRSTDLDTWFSNPNNLWIGPDLVGYDTHFVASKWACPFCLKKYGFKEALAQYENYIIRTKELRESLCELEGKNLGCMCRPGICHGDVLIKLYKRYCT